MSTLKWARPLMVPSGQKWWWCMMMKYTRIFLGKPIEWKLSGTLFEVQWFLCFHTMVNVRQIHGLLKKFRHFPCMCNFFPIVLNILSVHVCIFNLYCSRLHSSLNKTLCNWYKITIFYCTISKTMKALLIKFLFNTFSARCRCTWSPVCLYKAKKV